MSGASVWLQLTAGQGPVECALAVEKLVPLVAGEAASLGLRLDLVEGEPGEAGLLSALLSVEGEEAGSFARGWEGSILWICPSPLRPGWKRKNWFVAGAVLEEAGPAPALGPEAQLRWETFRSSGAGGQHVNKTESGVRLRHLPSGLVVECQSERSQHRNRALALAKLQRRLREAVQAQQSGRERERWRQHHGVERGSDAALRVYRGPSFARER